MTNTGKRYDENFKADIIRLIRDEKRTVKSIVKDFGLSEQTVRNWLSASKQKDDPDKVLIAQLQAELKAKNKELADHELTIEILKKATAIFAKNNRK